MLLSKEERDRLRKIHGDDQVFVILHHELGKVPNKLTALNKSTPGLISRVEQKGRYVMSYDTPNNPAFQQIMAMYAIVNKDNKFYITKPHHKVGALNIGSCQLVYQTHVRPEDARSIEKAATRHLEKHFIIERLNEKLLYSTGTLRDLMKDPGRIGFTYVCTAKKAKMKPVKGKVGKWMSTRELVDNYFYFDPWSKVIIDHLFMTKAAE